MKIRFLAVLAVVALVVCAHSAPKKTDLDSLQGEWVGTEANSAADTHSVLKISGDRLDFVGADTNEWYKGIFTLHENTDPKQVLGVIQGCPSADCIGKTIYAIYKIDEGVFTIAGNAPGETNFPSDFDAPGTRKIVFKRK